MSEGRKALDQGRIKATGLLVQVNAGALRSLDPRKAEAALASSIE